MQRPGLPILLPWPVVHELSIHPTHSLQIVWTNFFSCLLKDERYSVVPALTIVGKIDGTDIGWLSEYHTNT